MTTYRSEIPFESDAQVTLTGLRDDSGDYQNDATVEIVSVVDELTGNEVAGLTLPLALAYVAGSDGDYKVQLPDTAGFRPGRGYEAKIVATSASGLVRTFFEGVDVVKGRA